MFDTQSRFETSTVLQAIENVVGWDGTIYLRKGMFYRATPYPRSDFYRVERVTKTGKVFGSSGLTYCVIHNAIKDGRLAVVANFKATETPTKAVPHTENVYSHTDIIGRMLKMGQRVAVPMSRSSLGIAHIISFHEKTVRVRFQNGRRTTSYYGPREVAVLSEEV